jgi:hypothetical protein
MKQTTQLIIIIIIIILCNALFTNGRTLHIAPRGKDNNPGNVALHRQPIKNTPDEAVAGDTVIICNGVYRIAKEVFAPNSETVENWYTYLVLPGNKAVIDVAEFVSADNQSTYLLRPGLDGFHIQEVSYIGVVRLHVKNSILNNQDSKFKI